LSSGLFLNRYVDVNLLVDAFSAIKANLSAAELRRNALTHSLLFSAHPLGTNGEDSLKMEDGIAGNFLFSIL
jgi:hypothetical protein